MFTHLLSITVFIIILVDQKENKKMPSYSEIMTSVKRLFAGNGSGTSGLTHYLKYINPYTPAIEWEKQGKTHLGVIYFLSLITLVPYTIIKVRKLTKKKEEPKEDKNIKKH
jgi:D-alanyl-lipoteichoic acid acyltransferase DltB (MBOAT superfamily)